MFHSTALQQNFKKSSEPYTFMSCAMCRVTPRCIRCNDSAARRAAALRPSIGQPPRQPVLAASNRRAPGAPARLLNVACETLQTLGSAPCRGAWQLSLALPGAQPRPGRHAHACRLLGARPRQRLSAGALAESRAPSRHPPDARPPQGILARSRARGAAHAGKPGQSTPGGLRAAGHERRSRGRVGSGAPVRCSAGRPRGRLLSRDARIHAGRRQTRRGLTARRTAPHAPQRAGPGRPQEQGW